jgi:hypothetical protein
VTHQKLTNDQKKTVSSLIERYIQAYIHAREKAPAHLFVELFINMTWPFAVRHLKYVTSGVDQSRTKADEVSLQDFFIRECFRLGVIYGMTTYDECAAARIESSPISSHAVTLAAAAIAKAKGSP